MDLNKTLRATNHRGYTAHLAALTKMSETTLETLAQKGDLEALAELKYRGYRPDYTRETTATSANSTTAPADAERWAELGLSMIAADMDLYLLMQQMQREAEFEANIARIDALFKGLR
jgi:hypothetical protein